MRERGNRQREIERDGREESSKVSRGGRACWGKGHCKRPVEKRKREKREGETRRESVGRDTCV